MEQWTNLLVHKCKDLSSDPQNSHKNSEATVGHPTTQKAEAGFCGKLTSGTSWNWHAPGPERGYC